MPLQKMQLVPGINKESTSYGNEGGWFDCDKVRFRSGNPEKIGGWTRYSDTQVIGTTRALWNWLDLTSANWLALGTSEKFYIETGGEFNDITPLRAGIKAVTAPYTNMWYTSGCGPLTNCFTTASTSKTVILTIAGGHGAILGDYVTFFGVTGAYATDLNKEFLVTSIISSTQLTIELTSDATTSGVTGGTTTYCAFQITNGLDVYTYGTGWGVGTWNSSTAWNMPSIVGNIGEQLRLWTVDNYGAYLFYAPRGGEIYFHTTLSGTIPRTLTLAQMAEEEVDPYTNVPTRTNIIMSSAEQFVVLMGTQEFGLETGAINPLLVRWSDQANPYQWYPSITNQTGEYKISHGSYIVQAVQTRQETLIFTDSALYSMQYQGPPYVFGFNVLMDNISIMSPNSAYTVNGVTYWMGIDKFYMYSGTVETLPCTVKQYVFEDMNIDQAWQNFVGGNSGYNEVWWFYCSKYVLNADGTVFLNEVGAPVINNQINKYVIFNYLDRTWYIGTMARSAWLDSGLKPFPVAVDYNNRVLFHENSVDDLSSNTPVAINAHIASSEFDIEDGQSFGYIWRVLPDVNFNASTVQNPKVYMSITPRRNSGYAPGATKNTTSIPVPASPDNAQSIVETVNPTAVVSGNNYTHSPVYTIQEFTGQVYTRVRARQCIFNMSSNDLGVAWQLGAVRLDVKPSGRR